MCVCVCVCVCVYQANPTPPRCIAPACNMWMLPFWDTRSLFIYLYPYPSICLSLCQPWSHLPRGLTRLYLLYLYISVYLPYPSNHEYLSIYLYLSIHPSIYLSTLPTPPALSTPPRYIAWPPPVVLLQPAACGCCPSGTQAISLSIYRIHLSTIYLRHSIYLSISLYLSISIHPSIYLFVHLTSPPVLLSPPPSVLLSIHLSISIYLYLSIHLPIYLLWRPPLLYCSSL